MRKKRESAKEAVKSLKTERRREIIYKLLKRVEKNLNDYGTVKLSRKIEKGNILTAEELKSRFTI